MTVTGPDGKVLNFKAEGELGQLGMTELFFETVEPKNADVPSKGPAFTRARSGDHHYPRLCKYRILLLSQFHFAQCWLASSVATR